MKNPGVERQLSEFIGKYTPEIAEAMQSCRKKIHAILPRGYELVYDNYNALVFGYAPTERTSEALLSLAAYPRWITLFFLKGAALTDPEHLLKGSGNQVRGITLANPEDLDRPAVRALIAQALQPIHAALECAPARSTIVKSVSAKQRSRRPSEAKSGGKSPANIAAKRSRR